MMKKITAILVALTLLQAWAGEDVGTISRVELLATLTKALEIIDPVDTDTRLYFSGTSTSGIYWSSTASYKSPTVLENLVDKKEREKRAAERAVEEAKEKLALANTMRSMIERLKK